MKTKIICLLVLVCVLVMGCMTVGKTITLCGNNVIDEGETSENCCKDAGCDYEGERCESNICVHIIGLSPPLEVFACASIKAEILDFHEANGEAVPSVTVLVNSINEYIPLKSSKILLKKGDKIKVYLPGIEIGLYIGKNLSVGDITDINIRCVSEEDCFWSADIDNIRDTRLCNKK